MQFLVRQVKNLKQKIQTCGLYLSFVICDSLIKLSGNIEMKYNV